MPKLLIRIVMLCLSVLVLAGSSVATSAQAESFKADQAQVTSLKQGINFYRTATWRWQKKALSTPTRSEFLERRTTSVKLLRWSAELWRDRAARARKHYQSIVSDRGYLPPPQARLLGRVLAAHKGWTGAEWDCLDALWGTTKRYNTLESGWNVEADNPNSSAYGIPQALPGSKMGEGWKSSAFAQIQWGLKYIEGRYKTPCGALGFRLRKGSY